MANFTPQEIEQMLQEFFDTVGKRQYVGARYVPVFGRHNSGDINWDNSDAYEPLTIVYYNGDTYTSRQYVPSGIDISDTDYWVVTGRYNAQVEQYRQEVLSFQDQIDDKIPFPDSNIYPKYGTVGQVLSTLSDGTTKWENPVVPSDAQAEEVISQWLEDHPEATTTVQDNSLSTAKYIDGSVTDAKLSQSQGQILDRVSMLSDTANNIEPESISKTLEILTGTKGLIFKRGYYPVNNQGNVVDISNPKTDTTNAKAMTCAISACSPGDKFYCYSYGANGERAALGFLNSSLEGIYIGYGSGRLSSVVTAPANAAWIIVNNYYDYDPVSYVYKVSTSELLPTRITNIESDIDTAESTINNNTEALLFETNLDPFFSEGGIVTNVNVGDTVDINDTSSTGWHIIIPYRVGERIEVNAAGYNNPRLWAFTDSDYKLISKSSAIYDVTEVTLTQNTPGYFIININTSKTHIVKRYSYPLNGVEDVLENLIGVKPYKRIEEITPIYYKYITTSNSIYSLTDTTLNSSGSFAYSDITVSAGDRYLITGRGGSNPRLWAFTDTNYIMLSHSESSANETNLVLVAPSDGHLIANFNLSYNHELYKLEAVTTSTAIDELFTDGISRLENNTSNEPMEKLDIPLEFRDLSSESSSCDFSPTTMMTQIYGLFDALASANTDYVSKYDAALYDGLSMTYPVYANGIEEGQTIYPPSGYEQIPYSPTPAYKTYMYKFACESIGGGNRSNCPKQKVFIIAGTHGNERFAPFIVYLLMKMLCDATNANAFRIRSAFDFYVIPLLSGYGVYNAGRANGNRVNINRNYPTHGWQEGGSNVNFTGPSGGSEFETQLVMNLVEKIQPNVLIDAHNYGSAERQFYTVASDKGFFPMLYQCLTDCSFTFINELPTYFGNKWKLFIDDDAQSSPRVTGATTVGTTARWAYENNIPWSATFECGEVINFLDGLPDTQSATQYSVDAMEIADYTYRRLFVGILQYAMDKINTR